MNFFTIMKLVKEDISGIEILNSDRYKFTLIVFNYNKGRRRVLFSDRNKCKKDKSGYNEKDSKEYTSIYR